MGIFDEEESIILNKGIQAARDRANLVQKNKGLSPFDYGHSSNNDQALLEYDDKNKMQKLQDFTLGFGPASISKYRKAVDVFKKLRPIGTPRNYRGSMNKFIGMKSDGTMTNASSLEWIKQQPINERRELMQMLFGDN